MIFVVGKKYRRKIWGWRDGPSEHQGYAYFTRGRMHFMSNRTSDYHYGSEGADDWYMVDDNGFPVTASIIQIGGE